MTGMPLLYRAALQGVFGRRERFDRSGVTDALFVYLDGEPEPASMARVDSRFRGRPLVCLTNACVARTLRDCEKRGITVHWDAQNDASRHLAEKFGFEIDTEYLVYWV